MKKSILFLIAMFSPCVLLAASGNGEVDIIERTINFVIFFALVYYFAAEKIKGVFKERRENIANSLAKIQEKLQESKRERQRAVEELQEAKKVAKDIIEVAHKESAIILQKAEENIKVEIENLIRQFNESMVFERRKMEKQVIDEILGEFLNKDSVVLPKDVLTQALLRKVA
ncbi:F0F1 ATP synthase subunit B [Helicobacter canadensis]|uniref:ATP synthase subunit b n=1 Tax=Helicobacter canadensis MIT 98-5491 TaxID=537970 RepID=C5ZWR5_9HELI|nr:F0F1 ATP synthase subunit B [Helicobacter canadensis]EES89583.1 ATP synthase subunit B [Helicobacter canadensis MIT 98-5491]EFR48374.1 ATP synthase F0, B subunit [Helicobacter canadensis MIT 98-5491]STO99620.1 ATP synthase F0F1 subunit B [Helicobacter canadensis]